MSNRIVTYAKLHGGDAFIPGMGNVGSTLPPTNKAWDLKMYYTPDGLKLSVSGGKIEAMVPLANIQLVVFAPEDKPAVKLASGQ